MLTETLDVFAFTKSIRDLPSIKDKPRVILPDSNSNSHPHLS
jgi:hypothetical protein